MARANPDWKQVDDASSLHNRPTTLARSRLEVVDYIRTMSEQLGVMAESADLHLLAYFLDMVRLEAKEAAKTNPPKGTPRSDRREPG